MKDNVTRFVVLSRDPLVATDALSCAVPFKTSIVFSLQEVSLQSALPWSGQPSYSLHDCGKLVHRLPRA